MKTKTCLLLIVLSVLGMGNTSLAQENSTLDGYWYLNENTDLEFTGIYDSNEKLDYFLVSSFYGIEFYEARLKVKGDKFQLYFLEPNGEEYYDDQELDTVGKGLFQVLQQNDSILSLRPLDVGAVRFLDQIQQQGYVIEGEPERNEEFYTKYWNEVSKVKGKKRAAVINKWKTEHKLFVDEAVFHNENWYTEIKGINDDEPLIDSIYYSEMMVDMNAKDSVHYVDYKIYGNGKFVMRQYSALRDPKDGIPNVIFEREGSETVEFIPPVITKEEMPETESELDVKVQNSDYIDPPVEEVEEYDGYKSDIQYYDEEYLYVEGSETDGYYKGTFDKNWMNDLNAGLNIYGPSKQTHLGDSNTYTCDYSNCGKKHIRVFYKGTYKDFWVKDFRSPILLYSFLSDLSEKESYYTSFEPMENQTEKFPLSYQTK